MFNAMFGFVNVDSVICMLTLSVLNASIVMLSHTFFVVHVVKSAIVATCIQTGSSQYIILTFNYFGFHTRSVKMPIHILTSSLRMLGYESRCGHMKRINLLSCCY